MAQSHVRQHYVPVFLLEQWRAGTDNKVSHFSRRSDGEVVTGCCGPRGVGYQKHLYSQTDGAGHQDTSLEKDFFGPVVDNPAAPVHARLLRGQVDALTPAERKAWSRFLVAQMVRVPSMVDYVLQAGRQLMLSDVEDASVPEHLQSELGDRTLRDYLESEGAWRLDNASKRALTAIIESPLLNGVFQNAYWTTRKLKHGRWNLVIGDRPLHYEGQMNEDFLFILPLSPIMLFIAANREETVRTVTKSGKHSLIATINKNSVSQADTHVYATDGTQLPLVERYLRKANEPDDKHFVSSLRERLNCT